MMESNRTDEEVWEKGLEIMQAVYEACKVELLAIKTGEWKNAAWDKPQRDEFIDTLIEMLDEVEQDCPTCMQDKINVIVNYGIEVCQLHEIHPNNDEFTKAWNYRMYDVCAAKRKEMQDWYLGSD